MYSASGRRESGQVTLLLLQHSLLFKLALKLKNFVIANNFLPFFRLSLKLIGLCTKLDTLLCNDSKFI